MKTHITKPLAACLAAALFVAGCATPEPYRTKIQVFPSEPAAEETTRMATLIIPAGVVVTAIDGVAVPEWGSRVKVKAYSYSQSSVAPGAHTLGDTGADDKGNTFFALDLPPGEHVVTAHARLLVTRIGTSVNASASFSRGGGASYSSSTSHGTYKQFSDTRSVTFGFDIKAGRTCTIYFERAEGGGWDTFKKDMVSANFGLLKHIMGQNEGVNFFDDFQLDWFFRDGAEDVLLAELRRARQEGVRKGDTLSLENEVMPDELEKALNFYTTMEGRRKKNYPGSTLVATTRPENEDKVAPSAQKYQPNDEKNPDWEWEESETIDLPPPDPGETLSKKLTEIQELVDEGVITPEDSAALRAKALDAY